MKFRGIEKKGSGEYLNRYDVHYETPAGGEKVYEMFSRDGGIDTEEKLRHPRTDAVMIIMTDESREHLLLIREFRLELDREIYGLPAGLIDPGETPELAAKRELKEETGLDLLEIRLARGMGGKGIVYLCGELSSVRDAVEKGAKQAAEDGVLIAKSVIAAPAPGLTI